MENIKIAVIVCTYKRKNTNINFISKMFNILYKQTFQNFKLFLIGDCYDNNKEFEELCNSYKGDIYFKNLPLHFRDNYFKIPLNKWTCGGLNAITFGIKQAIKQNYQYYFHLDDDDLWEPNHLENGIKHIKLYPKVDFLISKSNYGKNAILPKEHDSINNLDYNNFNIKKCNSVHSSWIVNLNTLGPIITNIFDKYLDIIKKFKTNEIIEYQIPALDAVLLNTLSKLQKNNKINAICILDITVSKNGGKNIPI